ncbi:MAG: hypothetical protein J6X00_02075 [Clostridia bacterium]|nr:hypothetical protein [Clostridia bacterium]
MSLDQTIRVNKLIDLYGNLLTDKQRNIVKEYFCYNNSLSEISENYSISRQAVNYTIKQVLCILEDYEAKLKLLSKFAQVQKELENDTNLAKKISDILEE